MICETCQDTGKILHRYTGEVLYEGEGSTRELVVAAVKESADLKDADLRDAYLACTNLQGACLRDTDLQGARLMRADLRGADLRGANLRGAYLRDACLAGANLQDADLQGADLWYANFQGADLWYANFQGADLHGADLRGANLWWLSHALLSEILWRAAKTEAQWMLAAYVGRATTRCWDLWQEWNHPEAEWARRELAKWVRDGDGAPEWIKSAVVESPGEEDDE